MKETRKIQHEMNQYKTHNRYTRIAFLIAIIALYLFKVVITGSFSF